MPNVNRTSWLLILITIIGAILRFDFAYPYNFIIDSDEAIVGLMAKHVLEGQAIPTFYYGQHYMGSLEALLTAFCFGAFGISNWSLKLTPFLFSIALIPLMYHMVRRCADEHTGLIAALLTAIPPTPLVIWSTKARGGFIEIIFIGTLALLTTIIWLQRERPQLRLASLTGFLLGLGWWVNNQVIFFFVPVGLVFFQHTLTANSSKRFSTFIKHLLVGMLSFLIGSLPFWIYNLNHNFATFEMFSGADSHDISEHVSGLIEMALPIILGGKRFWQEEDLFPAGKDIVLLVYALLLLFVLVRRWRPLVRSLSFLGFQRSSPIEIFVYLVLSTLVIFTASSFGYLVQAPRYLLPVYAGLIPLSAYGINKLGRVIGTFIALLILAINLSSSYLGEKAMPGEPFVSGGERVSRDHEELIAWLHQNNYSLVKTNYWIGYRLAFETHERVKFLMFQEPYKIRIKQYEELKAKVQESQVPMILTPGQAKIVRHALRAMGGSFKEKLLSGYSVIYDITRAKEIEGLIAIRPDELLTSASSHNEIAHLAVDGSQESRWGSGEHQHAGMKFVITLKQPSDIRGIKMELGAWFHDFPRTLLITATLVDGSRLEVIDSKEYEAIEYYLFEMPFSLIKDIGKVQSIELRQEGHHPIFDWSIAEITLYRPAHAD